MANVDTKRDIRYESLLYLPKPIKLTEPTSTQTDPTILQYFAESVFRENIVNVYNTGRYIRRSFTALFAMYVTLFVIGLVGAIGTIVKGLTAQSTTDAGGAAVIGGLSVASFIAIFVTRPLESLERNAIYDTWLTAVANSYWTRLMYFDDPETIDKDLKGATDDLVDELEKLADKHAAAIGKYASAKETKPAGGDSGADGKPGGNGVALPLKRRVEEFGSAQPSEQR